MKPIEYPSKGSKEFADLVNDYIGLFATDLADKVTKRGRKKLDSNQNGRIGNANTDVSEH